MNNNDKFIIPQEKFSIIALFENNQVKEIGKIDVPYASKSVFLKNRLIISLCFGSKPNSRRLRIFDEYGNQLLKKTEYKFESINFKDNVVYLGGQHRKGSVEIFSYIDLTDIDFKLNKIDLPVKSVEGKSIDDILIRNNTMYLIDDIVYPKYVFKYDISIPNNPKHIGTGELENNGTYEHIKKGDINDNWIILFSSTIGMRGSYQHISIINKEEKWNTQEVLSFVVYSPEKHDEYPRVLDICLIKHKLLILKTNGLYCLDLTNKISKESMTLVNENKEKYNKLLKINNESCILLNGETYKLLTI